MCEKISDATANVMATQIWFVDVAACCNVVRVWEQNVQALDAQTKARLARIKSEDERMTRTIVHCALRVLIEGIKGPGWRGSPLVYSEKGRPSLPGLGMSLSLSHTQMTGSGPGQGAGLIALSSGGEVGVDIEARDRHIKMQPERQQAIIAAAAAFSGVSKAEAEQMTFISAWVRLEAYAKATGLGMAPLLTQAMARVRDPDSDQCALKALDQTNELAILSLEVDPNYVAAVAVGEPSALPNVCRFPTNARELERLLGQR